MELKKLIELFRKEDKPNIRGKILKLVFSGTVLTFAILGLFSFIGMLILWNVVDDRGESLGETASTYTKNFVKDETKEHLQEVTQIKAQQIQDELKDISCDVIYITRTLEEILSSPQDYNPVTLPNILDRDIYSEQAYLFYSPALRENLTPEIENEIAVVSNIGRFMEMISDVAYKDYFSEIFLGSKNGYLISVDVSSTEDGNIQFGGAFNEDYDPRVRPWYIEAEEKETLIFTDVFAGWNGYSVTCAAPYYDKNGFAGVVGIDNKLDVLDELYLAAYSDNSRLEFILNDKAQIIMVSQKENVLSAGEKDISESKEKTLVNVANRMTAGESGIADVVIGGEDYYLAFAPIEMTHWSFGTLVKKQVARMSSEEVSQNILMQMNDFEDDLKKIFLILPLVSIFILAIILQALLKKGVQVSDNFVKPIRELADGVREISSGNFDKKLNIKTGDEIEHLATCFNTMTDELQTYMKDLTKATADKERLATELDVAAKIQMSMLPQKFPARDDCEIFATMYPAKYVGGDFYDFYFLDDKHLVITIADVSGKGVPAAIFMAMSKTILKNYALMMQNPDDFSAVMALTNQQLCQNNYEKMFVTVFLGMLNLETGEFFYVNGGHNFPLVYRTSTQKFEYLDVKKSCLLGIKKKIKFNQQSLQLSRGDILFLYTDGVTEAMNEDYEEYLPERLEKTLNQVDKNAPLEEILNYVLADVKKHAGNAEQSDDITMLACRFEG